MTGSDHQAVLSLVNFVMNVGIAWACLCRISMMADPGARLLPRAGYSIAFTLSLASATLPLWGEEFAPRYGAVLGSGALLALLVGSSGAWSGRRPPAYVVGKRPAAPTPRETTPAPVSWKFVFAPLALGLIMLLTPIEKAIRGPVLTEWRVTEWRIEGRDVLLRGAMSKRWPCDWMPPHRAYDEEGEYYIVFSLSADAGKTRPASKNMRFGEWRVLGAAGRRLTFYSEHRCHPLWPTISTLGTLDTSSSN